MLSDVACKALIKQAKALDKPIKKSDSKGLYLHAFPNGSAYWRYKYRIFGVEKKMAFGVFPEISLAEAREKHRIAHKHVSENRDPMQIQKEEQLTAQIEAENILQKIALEWHGKNVGHWDPRYAKTILTRLEQDIFPDLGHLPIGKISPPILLAALQKIEARKALTIAKKCLGYMKQIFVYSNATGRPAQDVTTLLTAALQKHSVTHHRAMEANDLPDFLYALERNEKNLGIDTRNLVEMMLNTFVRTSELRRAERKHFDFKANQWLIPGAWMKMREDHIVPLSKQMVALIKRQMDLHPLSPYLFPSNHGKAKFLSGGTINSALDALGFSEKHTGHGFRALAKSTIKEKIKIEYNGHLIQKYNEEVVDIQLAHAPNVSNGGAYDRAKYLDQRTVMMQDWSNYLDECRIEGLQKALKKNRE